MASLPGCSGCVKFHPPQWSRQADGRVVLSGVIANHALPALSVSIVPGGTYWGMWGRATHHQSGGLFSLALPGSVQIRVTCRGDGRTPDSSLTHYVPQRVLLPLHSRNLLGVALELEPIRQRDS